MDVLMHDQDSTKSLIRSERIVKVSWVGTAPVARSVLSCVFALSYCLCHAVCI